jgi:ribosomal protein L11 methyltransferase
LKSDWPPSTHPDPEVADPGGRDGTGLTEFEVLADAQCAEAWSDALLQAGALSVDLEDADAGSESERPLYAESVDPTYSVWPRNRLRVLLGPGQSADQVMALAARSLEREPAPVGAVRRIAAQDWVQASREQFAPLRIGRLWVVPTWIEPPDASALNLRLDPGMAFGTGAHPSTHLCLRWLQDHLTPGASVLDYGCGSGILAIAAAKLGAARVVGVDIDPAALRAAHENSRRNDVRADYTAPGLLSSVSPSGRFDIVIANIVANPLVLLAPVLVGHLAEQGSIVLAGVLARQSDALVDAYRAADARLHLSVWGRDGDWVCLTGCRASR